MARILNEDEIKKVRKSMITISIGNVGEMIKKGGIVPTDLSNGYSASLSLDVIRENLRMIHLSVSNKNGKTNVKIAKHIADDIIGEGSEMIGAMNLKNVLHFMKIEKENTLTELMKDIDTKPHTIEL